MIILTDLKQQMEAIKDELMALEEARNYHTTELQRILDRSKILRDEGRRLGEMFKQARSDQRAAVEFVEGLLIEP